MGIQLDLWFDSFDNTFALIRTDHLEEPTAVDGDEEYGFAFHLIRGLKTGEIVGFGNDGGNLAEDYYKLMEFLEEKPISELYDVPALNLYDATIGEIITAIYRRFVLAESEVSAQKIPEGQTRRE
ncbi:MAG: hypothetical protein ACUVV0_00635 [Anaerolineae bacterium]